MVAIARTDVDVSSTQTITGKTITGATITGATLTTSTITSPQVNQINDTGGAAALVVTPTASAVNQVTVAGTNSGGSNVSISATGTASDLFLTLSGKGTYGPVLRAGLQDVLVCYSPGITSTNYFQIDTKPAGGTPSLKAMGETNVSLDLQTSGTGTVRANGVQVVDLSSNQTLTTKTLTTPTLTTPVINGATTGTGVATANTVSTLVQRDASGNFSAGTITAALSGNATTATSAATLTTSRNFQTNLASTSPASFNGSTDSSPGVTGTLAVGSGGTGATTLTGLVKGTGTTAMVAATAGTDYIAPDANANVNANAYIATRTSTATAAGTTTLSITSSQVQVFTGSSAQTVRLPTTGVIAGQSYTIVNQSSGVISVQSSAGNGLPEAVGASGGMLTYTARIDTPTAAADWICTAVRSVSIGYNPYTGVMRDPSGVIFGAGFNSGVTTTATSGGTLTVASTNGENLLFTGSSNHTCQLPTSSVFGGRRFTVLNNSTGAITVNASGGATIATVAAGTAGTFVSLQSSPTTAAHWFKVS